MSKLIYLETDDEITDVIDKISKVDEKSVSLVIPRGSTLANSIVNLKLLSKRGKELGKDVALVTNDKIAKNLASQIGLSVFGSVSDAKASVPEPESTREAPPAPLSGEIPAEGSKAAEEIDGVKVHQYNRSAGEAEEAPKAPAKKTEPKIPEVIEAVKDIDEGIGDEDIIPKDAPTEDVGNYKLIKKPMPREEKMRAQHPGKRTEPLFEKIRLSKKRRKLIIGGIIAGAVVLILALLYIVLPKAKATVSVVSEPFTSTADITVNKDASGVDNGNMTIPGKLIGKEEELEKPFAASGQKNIGEKAKGKVTVYNNWGEFPISLPTGTKFSGGGAEFVSTAAVTVPGAQDSYRDANGNLQYHTLGTADVNVEATSVGEQGNIGPSNFTITTIPKVQQTWLTGKSAATMTGGSNNIVKVVADKDLKAAKESTEKELKAKITDEIKAGLAGNEQLLDQAIGENISAESSSDKAGDQVDAFFYKIKIKIEAITFSEDDAKILLLDNAKNQLPQDKEIVSNADEKIKYEVANFDLGKGTITLKGTFDGYIAAKYDISAIKKEIKGRSIKTATNKITAHTGVLSVDITTWPGFLRSLPLIERRINIEFNYGSQ